MLTLNGTVANVFRRDQSIDKKTGEIIPSSEYVQVQAENTLQNGEKRIELVTLKVEHGEAYRRLVGRSVRLPVGAFVVGNAVQFYALKGLPAPTEASETGPARPGARARLEASQGASVLDT